MAEARGLMYEQKQVGFLRSKFGSGTTLLLPFQLDSASHRASYSQGLVNQTPRLKETRVPSQFHSIPDFP